jgi:TetR/AcrR family transcriptional regulator, transcriptional repressor for nem operon
MTVPISNPASCEYPFGSVTFALVSLSCFIIEYLLNLLKLSTVRIFGHSDGVNKIDQSRCDSFLDHIQHRLADQTNMPKRERTRERLRIATVQVLNQHGYEDMRALTITEKAGLSEGLFYVYFKSKADITLDILSEFYLTFVELDKFSELKSTPLEVIQAANRRWISVAVANPGLMRCVFQAGHEVPQFAELLSKINRDWYQRIYDSLQRRKPVAGKEAAMLGLYMLGGMMDELVRKLVVYPDPELIKIFDATGSDYEAVADAASMIWYRVLYLDDESRNSLSTHAQQFVGHIG